MKIEQVTRRAQEQFQMVLEEQSRFALDIDLDAPKVRVPIRTCGSSKCDSHFLLDFGHFTLHTKDSQHGEQRQNLYSRFFITGRDIAAFFVDCGSDCQSCTLDVPDYDYHPLLSPTPDNVENCYSLIDRCGMAVLVDQIIVPHPSYPSMRISIQVPNLGIHFSPSRFQRLMKLLNIFCGTLETCNASQPALDDFQAETPWSLSDLSTEARILAWRGIGNSVATWQLCYLVLSGINLYVLESEKSQSHQRHTSMAGRQVYEVPPANIGGSLFCVAVSYRGMDNQKALESPTTLIIEFRAEHEKAIWLKGLIQATYQASAPPSVNVLGETSDPVTDYGETHTMNSKTADLVINGALVETKIFIYGKTGDKVDEERCETLILEVLANGGKLHMIRWEGDLTLKMKLHSLKIKDELQVRLSTTPQYLACSVLNIDDLVSSPGIVDPHMKEMSALLHEDDDTFTDALPDFMSISDTGLGSQIMDMDTCATTEDVNDDTGFATPQAIIHEKKLVKEKVISGEIFYEADGGDNSNFVSVTFLTRSPSSPDYDGIDTQMNLRMSKLEFFCNRPTLVSLIDFGLDLSCVYDVEGSADMTKVPDDKPLMNKEKNEESVKGLLGYGKGRVVFYLNMNVDNVTVFLNKEDGSSFAMFVQESFLLDLKVHPSSLSIEGTLGNFRLHDMSLGTDHCWAWLCDIRNPGVESLIKFKFNSYSAEDDDFEGYDYSLCGRLSAVRIIFLYRFVQEITEYFMELATPHTEEAIKLVDKVGGFEWLIQKYEIDGATALKLDLSLDTPIIIVPRNSTSKDFIQLDLGQLKVTNEFSWYGSPEKDPSAVHIDVLHAEILGISMSVGIDGCLGKSMIREGKGLDVYVRRSLRDVFKKVPTFALEVKVGLLHGVMSDKEYKVILDCACMNLCEEPKLPPSFRGGKSGSMDTMRLLADKVNMNSQLLLSKTVTIVAVVIDNALLELYNGIHAESPFAQIAIEGLWVMYRMTSLSETDLYITIPKFSVVDIRPNTKPEMRLMLGSSADDSKQVSSGSLPLSLNKGSFRKTDSDAGFSHVDLPISTMFLMDYRWRKSSQSFVVRVQQPRVLVVADFLLAVGEFFVPALRTITGREEVMDPTNDLIGKSCSIVFSGPIYKQIEDVVHLSPSRQLVADCLHIDEYIYDGCGKTIHLSEETDTKYLHSTRPHPIIIIGCGKKLRFMNVKIENGSILRKYTHLSNDSSYSLSFEDGVDITLLDSYSSDEDKKSLEDTHKSSDTSNISSDSESDPNVIPSFSFEAQVVSPEFTFYDSSKSCLDDSYGEKLLRAKLDFSFMYASKENDTWVRALVKDLTVEAGSGLIVLDPVDISGGYTSASTLLARADLKKPSSRLAYAIGDSLKPKTRENITAEVKLRCFSLTVLDSLCGMMKPLFDTTITNIKLATHGRLEAMNAVLISSIAASTFNTQLEAWEPLVEPFDGIFKFETYDTNVHSPSKFGKTVRIAATSILNLNVSAANLETFIGSVLSWKRQLELEQKAMKINEEAGGLCGQGEDQTLFALDEDDFQTVIVENKLGCEIYVKRVEENSDRVDRLHHGDYISIWVPPPRFSDRFNVVDESKEARYYVAIQIHKAKDLPIIDDGNSHNFFCALRLVVDSQATDQQKLFPQSARTKCVKPAVSEFNNLNEGTAEWNELFIFEVPRKGPAKVEVELTNLAAKAGKGEVVGALSFSVGQGANVLRKMASVRVFHQGHDVQNVVSHPLRGRVRHNSTEDMDECGCLLVSTSYFERKTTPSFQRDLEAENVTDRDIGFSVGLGPDGVWQNIRSLLPLSVVPKWLQNDFMALEVVVKNGKKHAIFRGLATVVNETDVKLKISVCHASRIQGRDSSLRRSDSINPGSSFILPWRSTSSDSDQCLQICPSVDHPQPPYSWGSLAAVGTGYTYGKDLTIIDQVSLSRQYTSEQENNLQNVTFKLNQLEKKDILLCCTSTINKQFWLSVGADASALHTELNAPVYDWKISVHSPMKLENRLSCPAEFTIWERTRDGKCVERQHGMISSRGGVHIYSADIQKPLYLTLFVEGGWVLEKDPVLLLNLYSNDHVSSFWMVHQKSKRRLRVSIEREMGGTTVAPKTIKFFVPYWITNDSSISLAYRVVEVEPSDNADTDSLMLSREVKSATPALRSPTNSRDRKHSATRRNIQVLEVIEDTSPVPNMLSPQDYASRSGASLFPSQKDVYLSSRVGLSVAMHHSEIYSPGISLFELEKKERLDVKVFSSDGSYYKLSARLSMTSDRTKVVHFQPHTLFINRVGYRLCLQQCDSQSVAWIHPTDSPKPFCWHSSAKVELLKASEVRVDDYKWSAPFSVSSEGVMRVCLKKDDGNEQLQFRIAVRSGAKNSSYEVVFRPNSSISPYRIENRSMFLPIRIRQVDGTNDSWKVLLPNTAASFLWEDLGRRRLLEILVEGEDPLKSGKYDIDEISDHQPIHLGNVPSKALRVTVIKEEKVNVIKISDWMPEIDPSGILSTSHTSPLSQLSIQQQSPVIADCEFHVIIELAELGISIIDHTPEEILYLSVQNLVCAYSTGLGSGISRFKLRMRGIQLDNQLPLSPTPVLFRPQKVGDDTDYILKVSITMQSNGSLDLCVYPYIGLQGPENSAFLVNIHEPIIWRLHEMIQQVNLSRLSDTQTTAVSVDPIIEIGVLSISEVRFKVSMAMSPSQRPRGVLGFWASLMTALGNTENMPVRIYQKFNENVCMRQSSMISIAISNAQKDLLGQPLQLLSGVDILGNASSALGHMSKGMAALSFDKKFIQSRQRKESKGVEDFGDVLREGGGALAKGLFRGVTGILTKPLEGAKNSGVEGFVQGVGKGLIGAAAQPVSGVLDLLSKTTEGANAMRMKIASAITSDEQLLRKRLPRVIGGDNLIRPYDGYKAQGQAILQLAESGSFFLQVDLFKVRGKFALSDAYEDHSLLRKGKILLVTHRRAILLQQPFNVAQKKFNPARDPCSVLWDVLWDDLVIMEKSYGKKDHPKSPPSRVILYLQDKSEMKEHVRIIKCLRDTPQALDVYSSIERAMNTYGPNKPKQMLKKSMTLPYAPFVDNTSAEATSKEPGSPRQVPASIPRSSTFGSRFN
ncbi:hypothetical protein C1H46_011592 [Malus baccata]|uniref:C2 domain-containing protein n=1 Tax=Malus baccata TaxID=106549 RepID=A0A540MWX5_MALBA|nr:hypothetical protein C1H46_011592 [Malus baccata]